jgi:hypothetical protein
VPLVNDIGLLVEIGIVLPIYRPRRPWQTPQARDRTPPRCRPQLFAYWDAMAYSFDQRQRNIDRVKRFAVGQPLVIDSVFDRFRTPRQPQGSQLVTQNPSPQPIRGILRSHVRLVC